MQTILVLLLVFQYTSTFVQKETVVFENLFKNEKTVGESYGSRTVSYTHLLALLTICFTEFWYLSVESCFSSVMLFCSMKSCTFLCRLCIKYYIGTDTLMTF